MRNARPAKAKPRAGPSSAAPRVVRGDRIPRAYHQLRELIVSGRPARRKLVATMRELNGGLRQAAAATRPDPMRIFHLDTSFHQSYVEAGAGPRLLALHNAIKPQAERYVRLYTSALVDEIAQSVVEHERIIEEIDTGGAEGARRAVQRNWRNAAGRLSSVIRTLGERGSW